jgi:hypothetical protein
MRMGSFILRAFNVSGAVPAVRFPDEIETITAHKSKVFIVLPFVQEKLFAIIHRRLS